MLNLLKRLKNRGQVRDAESAPTPRAQLAFDFFAPASAGVVAPASESVGTSSTTPTQGIAAPTSEITTPHIYAAPRVDERLAPTQRVAETLVLTSSDTRSSLLPIHWQAPVDERAPRPSRGRAALRAQTGVMFSKLEALGLRGVDTLVLMRTRTVMVSLIGRTLRVNEGYADADETVLRAVVAFATARTKVARNQARDVILAHDVERGPMPRRAEPEKPGDSALIAQLAAAHKELNDKWFAGALTALPLRLSGRMATRLGHYDPGSKFTPSEIVMSRKHVVKHGWREAMHTLLHEMVHQWQHETGRPVDHGSGFRKKCREVGITPSARRDVVPLSKRRLA